MDADGWLVVVAGPFRRCSKWSSCLARRNLSVAVWLFASDSPSSIPVLAPIVWRLLVIARTLEKPFWFSSQ